MVLEGGSVTLKDNDNSVLMAFQQLNSTLILKGDQQEVQLSLDRIQMRCTRLGKSTEVIDQPSQDKLLVLRYKGKENTHEIGLKVEKLEYRF